MRSGRLASAGGGFGSSAAAALLVQGLPERREEVGGLAQPGRRRCLVALRPGEVRSGLQQGRLPGGAVPVPSRALGGREVAAGVVEVASGGA